MTVAHPSAAARTRARRDYAEPRPINWAAVGVILAILVQAASGIWFAATQAARLHALEVQIPPGSIQALQVQSLATQKAVEEIQHALMQREPRP